MRIFFPARAHPSVSRSLAARLGAAGWLSLDPGGQVQPGRRRRRQEGQEGQKERQEGGEGGDAELQPRRPRLLRRAQDQAPAQQGARLPPPPIPPACPPAGPPCGVTNRVAVWSQRRTSWPASASRRRRRRRRRALTPIPVGTTGRAAALARTNPRTTGIF